jgi:uncharacterized protein with GYD domain
MPLYMHQWRYKADQIRPMLLERDERAHVVQVTVEAFRGKLEAFYFCLGDCDGMAISRFPDDETALACLMAIYAEGRVQDVRTSVLVDPPGILRAKLLGLEVTGLHAKQD